VSGARGLSAARPLPLGARLALAVEIVAAYAVARRGLRRRGLRDVLRELRSANGGPPAGADAGDPLAVGRRLGRAVRRTLGVLPADSRCLMSSLVLTRLLARRGIQSQLVISVRPGERFAAHAWVEHDGAALLPPDAPESARLTTL
jgi:hypothetical protein